MNLFLQHLRLWVNFILLRMSKWSSWMISQTVFDGQLPTCVVGDPGNIWKTNRKISRSAGFFGYEAPDKQSRCTSTLFNWMTSKRNILTCSAIYVTINGLKINPWSSCHTHISLGYWLTFQTNIQLGLYSPLTPMLKPHYLKVIMGLSGKLWRIVLLFRVRGPAAVRWGCGLTFSLFVRRFKLHRNMEYTPVAWHEWKLRLYVALIPVYQSASKWRWIK